MENTLREDQVRAFDTDYFVDLRLNRLFSCLAEDFGEKPFRLLDIGCGNGLLVDRILARFPAATATAVDNSSYMVQANVPHERKRVLLADATQLPAHLGNDTYDVILLNWILHHLVDKSWTGSRHNIRHQLLQLHGLLAPGGRLSVYENCYDGLLLDNFPAWLIHRVASTPMLSRFARSQGANTAGVGVCFQSRRSWTALFESSRWSIRHELTEAPWHSVVPLKLALTLHLRKVYCNHFWLEAQPEYSPGRDRPPR